MKLIRASEHLVDLASETEQALLGSLLVSPDALTETPVDRVAPSHFLTHRNGFVFEAILRLHSEGRPIDLLIVAQELEKMGKLQEVGGHAYLTQLTNTPASSVYAAEYAAAVLQHAESAKLESAAAEIARLSTSSPNGSSRWAEAQGILNRYVEGEPIPGMGLLTYPELQAIQWSDDPQLVPDLLPSGGLAAISGDTGAGKTFLALDIHMAVAEAGACLGGRQVTRGGPTLYLGIDNSTRTLQKRTHELAIARGIDPDVEGFHLYQDPIDLSTDAGAATLRRLIEETGVILVTVDMLNRYIGRVDLNSMSEVGPPLMRLRRIADETGATILLLHRLNKQGQSYGSVDIKGSVDSAMELTLSLPGGNPVRTLKHTKHRDLETVQAMTFSIQAGADAGLTLAFDQLQTKHEQRTAAEALAEQLIDVLRESAVFMTRNELAEAIEVDPGDQNFKRACAMLPDLPDVEFATQGRAHAYRHSVAE